MCTSEPTSDSSDTGGSGKSNDVNKDWDASSQMNNTSENGNAPFPIPEEKESYNEEKKNSMECSNDNIVQSDNV